MLLIILLSTLMMMFKSLLPQDSHSPLPCISGTSILPPSDFSIGSSFSLLEMLGDLSVPTVGCMPPLSLFILPVKEIPSSIVSSANSFLALTTLRDSLGCVPSRIRIGSLSLAASMKELLAGRPWETFACAECRLDSDRVAGAPNFLRRSRRPSSLPSEPGCQSRSKCAACGEQSNNWSRNAPAVTLPGSPRGKYLIIRYLDAEGLSAKTS